ncbi:amino acid adenylation domain-containing protein [Shewanella alkalitolerans]|uniref:amino acid adenylation domain-containing protein n=1 Tax=Shewanella alkalitolerans TaxID=2864209 RepID=UPI001C65E7EC|nr:amino acid adenylation domain-containing protein [Shewanella alkalitolerans]QYJ98951.1 amino acid adenylation domain-containing protein [Shewanella alkalitolerans]
MRNSIIKYLREASLKHPENICISDADNSLTYGEVVAKSYAISTKLEELYCKNKPIVVFTKKSVNALMMIFSATMAGGIYCPVDIGSPKERLTKILTSLGNCIVLYDNASQKMLESLELDDLLICINIDNIETATLTTQLIWVEVDIRTQSVIDKDPCYIIFTSGSTGVPKGVTICHASVIDYIDWANSVYSVNQTDVIGSQAPLFFDNSTLDIYLALSNAAELHVIPESVFIFPQKTLEYLNGKNITTIFWVPSLLVNIANLKLLDKLQLPYLRNILFAGEVMPAKTIRYWLDKHPEAHYSNLYGPTEITVDCTYYDVPLDWTGDNLPIGIPCNNSGVLILDEHNQLSEEGEMCVRGSSLALGYWADSEKTEEVFVQNPLHANYNDQIYRTGDLVKRIDGLIYYIGRKDFQIKHNGYRIELGEIETQLMELESTEHCVVGYLPEKKMLYSFIQCSSEVSEVEIKVALIKYLPKYMIPNKIWIVQEMLFTPNGKLNRKAYAEKALQELI